MVLHARFFYGTAFGPDALSRFFRDAFVLLIFRRIDGKLYLAAFTREFQAVVEPLYQQQWF